MQGAAFTGVDNRRAAALPSSSPPLRPSSGAAAAEALGRELGGGERERGRERRKGTEKFLQV